ncbi:MAG: SCO family protein [Myxococcota bacterium]
MIARIALLLAVAAAPLPSDSILQLEDRFTAQDGSSFTLVQRRGQPQLITMFYTSCKYVCPLVIDSVRALESSLSEGERAKLKVLLVSIDPKRDTPEALLGVAKQRHLDLGRWTLARAEGSAVRKLAGLLGIRYREREDGELTHTPMLVLLDPEGRVLARSEKLGVEPDAEFLEKLRAALH